MKELLQRAFEHGATDRALVHYANPSSPRTSPLPTILYAYSPEQSEVVSVQVPIVYYPTKEEARAYGQGFRGEMLETPKESAVNASYKAGTARDITAIMECIEHWKKDSLEPLKLLRTLPSEKMRGAFREMVRMSTENCVLCKLYHADMYMCNDSCPLKLAGNHCMIEGSSYANYADAMHALDDAITDYDVRAVTDTQIAVVIDASESMIAALVALLPEKEES